MTPETFRAFKDHANSRPTEEVCGIIVDEPERYIPCRNVASDPTCFFDVDPESWCVAERKGKILGVCHSHPGGTSKPSDFDVTTCNAVNLPFFILGTDGLFRVDPVGHHNDLVGRPFRFGWNDCYSLLRDFFGDMHDYPRRENLAGVLYHEFYEAEGFFKVSLDDLQERDVLMVKRHERAYLPDHAAIFIGAGEILHHPTGRCSCIERLDFETLRRVSCVLRRSHDRLVLR